MPISVFQPLFFPLQVHPPFAPPARHLRHHLRGVALPLRPLLGGEPRRDLEAGGHEHGAGGAHKVSEGRRKTQPSYRDRQKYVPKRGEKDLSLGNLNFGT